MREFYRSVAAYHSTAAYEVDVATETPSLASKRRSRRSRRKWGVERGASRLKPHRLPFNGEPAHQARLLAREILARVDRAPCPRSRDRRAATGARRRLRDPRRSQTAHRARSGQAV